MDIKLPDNNDSGFIIILKLCCAVFLLLLVTGEVFSDNDLMAISAALFAVTFIVLVILSPKIEKSVVGRRAEKRRLCPTR